jgi:hypothetical protein
MKQSIWNKLASITLVALLSISTFVSTAFVTTDAHAAAGYSTTLRNARLDAITTAVGNAGVLTIYSGTQPATCGTATTVLVNFTMGTPFAPAASAAVLSPTLPSATAASATGTASWARIKTSGGTCVMDMPVGTSGTPLILNSLSITSGVNVTITSFAITTGNP